VVFAAREAHDNGITVTELDTSWLSIPPEEAIIQARIETYQEDAQAEQIAGEVGKVLGALRAAGYEPVMRIEDIEITGGEPLLAQAPAQPAPYKPGQPYRVNPADIEPADITGGGVPPPTR
jgi:hypothetical protein